MRETEEERERAESRKAVARYELVRRRIRYGEEDPYGVYEAPIPDYIMLGFGLLEEPRDDPDGRCREPGVSDGNRDFARGREERAWLAHYAANYKGSGDWFEAPDVEEDR